MAGVSIAALCRALPENLRPVHPKQPPDTELSAVHISELHDPTVYLDGGELLLTTGLKLPHSDQGCRDYVDRLVRGEVAALGFGGPKYSAVPPRLIRACRALGLCLLEVPEPTPFLTVTRAFWAALSDADQRELSAALTAHRDLVEAAVGPEPVTGILRALASAVSGWAAYLDVHGELLAVWPPEREQLADQLYDETARLRGAGLRAAATFPLGEDDVVTHPLATGEQVVGYLATAVPPPMSATDRRVVLTACALLSLDAELIREKSAGVVAARTAVAHLLDLEQTDAARELADRMGVRFPPGLAHVFVFDGVDEDTMAEVVNVLGPQHEILTACTGDTAWCLIPADVTEPDLPAVQEVLTKTNDHARALLGPPVELRHLVVHRERLNTDLRRRPPSSVSQIATRADNTSMEIDTSRAQLILAPLVDRDWPEVIEALAAYLRHHGQWEAAARELNVHRNTLRYRIGRAERVLGRDLRDPDTTASLWLALRTMGLA